MTAPGLGRRPETDSEWARRVENRLRRLEQTPTTRIGRHVFYEDPVSGHLQTISDDGRVTPVTSDPVLPDDVIAGVTPGLFSASRLSTTLANATSNFNWLPDNWYDNIETTSDRMSFNPAVNELTVDSTAILEMTLQNRIASTVGARGWRMTLGRKRTALGETTFTVVRQTINQWQSTNHIIVGGTFTVPCIPGDVFKPGYYGTESATNALSGDPDPSYTRWDVVRIIDLS